METIKLKKNEDIEVDYADIDFSDIDKVVELNEPLVHYVIKKSFPWLLNTCHYDDAVQEGLIGLFKCAQLFDPEARIKFSTYAYVGIQRNIYRGVRSLSTPTQVPRGAYTYFKQYTELSEEGLSFNEIVEKLEVSKGVLQGIINSFTFSSLQTVVASDGGEITLADLIASPIEEEDITNETVRSIKVLMNLIPNNYREIFEMYLAGVIQIEIARKFNTTQTNISRLIVKCRNRFTNAFKDYLIGNIGYGEMLLQIYKWNTTVADYLRCYIDYALELCDRGHLLAPHLAKLLNEIDLIDLQDGLNFKRKHIRNLKKLITLIDEYCSTDGIEELVEDMVGVYSKGWLDVVTECNHANSEYVLFA